MLYYTLHQLMNARGDGDPGYVTEGIQNIIFRINGIDKEKIGQAYSKAEVAEMCTENYFIR